MDIVKHFRLAHDPFRAERDTPDTPLLSHEEARRFIATRVGVAGRTDLFSPAALDVVATASRGRPAALRLLAGNAMFHAAFDGARRVEETHARQAAVTQDIWRDVPAPPPAAATAVPVGAASATATMAADLAMPALDRGDVIAPAAVAAAIGPRPVADARDEVIVARRGWWRSVPPLARLAMVVGLLLLSLPVIGYVVGAVKDDRPAADSSYLPDDGELAAADAEAPIDVPPDVPAVAATAGPVEVADAGPPVDLTADTAMRGDAADIAGPDQPVAIGAGQAELVDPPEVSQAPEPVVAPTPAAEPDATAGPTRVFVHYSSAQPDGATAAEAVARNLRAQGFTVADIRAVPMTIETASVRYFFQADRASAEALHEALGTALRPRGYSGGDLKSMLGYDPAPRRGTLEVWVPAG